MPRLALVGGRDDAEEREERLLGEPTWVVSSVDAFAYTKGGRNVLGDFPLAPRPPFP